MKKIMYISFLITISTCLYSQSILEDKKDPFTNTRIIITGLNGLSKAYFTNTLQVQSQIDVQKDSIVAYRLTFVTPGLSLMINNKDSIKNTCLIKDSYDSIYSGTLINEQNGTVITTIQAYSCTFSTEDFYKIVIGKKITDVKITTDSGKGGLFSVNDGLQDNISRQAKILIKEFKNHSLK